MRFIPLLLAATACRNSIKSVVVPNDDAVVVQDLDGDGYNSDEDCDDSSDLVNPSATELCDGQDNNCDDQIDEGVLSTFYTDGDGDGFGDPTSSVEACEAPEGTVPNANDCDDSNANAFPSNNELCDGIDNDCDDEIDEDVGDLYFPDADGDGFGDDSEPTFLCELAPGYAQQSGDCDDSNAIVNPDAVEVCDTLDNNCDGSIDEGVVSTYYVDQDADGYGDAMATIEACDRPDGAVENSSDCDDTDPLINPAAQESCDSVDNDCDGSVDEEGAIGFLIFFLDADGDSYGDSSSSTTSCAQPIGYVSDGSDCDDNNIAINPGATEVCDAIDNDCDGSLDDADSSVVGLSTWALDHDGDGFGDPSLTQDSCAQPAGYISDSSDCDDTNPDAYPGALEVCDGFDNSCNSLIDDADPALDQSSTSTWYDDVDGDGYGDPASSAQSCAQPPNTVDNDSDCDDTDAAINPMLSWFLDVDGDGFGNALYVQQSCTQPFGYVQDSTDCDDLDASLNPQTAWFLDLDGDGYGANISQTQCAQPAGFVMNNLDCDDTEELAWQGAVELCDEVDNDCNGQTDEGVSTGWYLDYDGDGYGDDLSLELACTAPSALYIDVGGDCDDTDNTFSPGVAEGCDNLDRNCDGLIDNDLDGDFYSDAACGGSDCDDSDPAVLPEQNGGCAVGETCLSILGTPQDNGDGSYIIDPDGYAVGAAPFEVYCDMSTDDGGWTQFFYNQAGDAGGYSALYASVFSDVSAGALGSGSYKHSATELLTTASELRYSEPLNTISDSRTPFWTHDYSCQITADVLDKIATPGYMNQVPAAVSCTDLGTGNVATNAVYFNYQGWSGCWTGPRLWIGSTAGSNYHGDYCVGCISTWKCDDTINGVYSGPSAGYFTSVAIWLR